jgi:hypothetical protein
LARKTVPDAIAARLRVLFWRINPGLCSAELVMQLRAVRKTIGDPAIRPG